uniref:Claudin n=1 Tax=Mesocestoides corti TaxID=53468 RepID=A0A5K3EI51_MESCO
MRAARKIWVTLVTTGEIFVLAAIATNLTAICTPNWMEYNIDKSDFYPNRGLFQNCKGSLNSECLEISNPLHASLECLPDQGTSCTEEQQKRTEWINRIRIADWAFELAALLLETVTSFGCIFYLLLVRYCISKPSAQSAQTCLAVSGYLLWLSAIATALGIISFEGSLTLESITTKIKINSLVGNLQEADWNGLTQNYGHSSYLIWSSAGLSVVASWLWIVASFVQPPPHISPSMGALTTSSTVPLYPLAPKQAS